MGIRKLKNVYDMSFAEFQIRLFAYRRVQEREWEKVRLLAWHIESASFHRKGKMPSLDRFMKLGLDNRHKSGVSDSQKENFLLAYKDYLTKIKNG